MRQTVRLICILACVALMWLAVGAGAWAESGKEVPLNSLRVTKGTMLAPFENATVNARPLKSAYHGSCEVALDGRYDWFICSVAEDDSAGTGADDNFWVDLNGTIVFRDHCKVFNDPKPVKVRVKDAMRMRIGCASWAERVLFINPRLVKGDPPANQTSTSSATTNVGSTSGETAPFAVDPNDLDKLAAALRKKVDDDAALKSRVSGGQVALMTFTLVDIPSASVATNVAEDLSTAMINAHFQLVERGQLDKVIKELGIQQSGLMDPETVQKIGKQAGCDLVLLGSVSDRGQFVAINARLIETVSGKALCAERVEMRKIPISK